MLLTLVAADFVHGSGLSSSLHVELMLGDQETGIV